MLIFIVYIIFILCIFIFIKHNTIYSKKYKKCVKFSNPLIKSIHIY